MCTLVGPKVTVTSSHSLGGAGRQRGPAPANASGAVGTIWCMTDSARDRLAAALVEITEQIGGLEGQLDEIVAASQGSNADDEHDPEGATIAFERQQVVSLIERSRATRDDIVRAVGQLDVGTYGVCEQCGQPIGAERLEARPNALTCITCARLRS